MRQVEASVSERERKGLQRDQERLLLRMERKGEQISKLYKHKTQVCNHATLGVCSFPSETIGYASRYMVYEIMGIRK